MVKVTKTPEEETISNFQISCQDDLRTIKY